MKAAILLLFVSPWLWHGTMRSIADYDEEIESITSEQ